MVKYARVIRTDRVLFYVPYESAGFEDRIPEIFPCVDVVPYYGKHHYTHVAVLQVERDVRKFASQLGNVLSMQ